VNTGKMQPVGLLYGVHAHTHTCTHSIHTHTCTHTGTQAHTHTHVYTHRSTHIHTRIHTGMLPLYELRLDSFIHQQQPTLSRSSYSHVDNEGVKALVDSICQRWCAILSGGWL